MNTLVGERITLICAVYIYTGKLVSVSAECVTLTEAAIVYETGPFNDSKWKDAQSLPHEWNVQKTLIESFGIMK
jgi:hypothetical protein